MRGTKPLPNSLCKRSASAGLRTEPNTRNPFETSTFVVPQPIPVETPVTTTSLLFAIAFLLRWVTVHLHSHVASRWAQDVERGGGEFDDVHCATPRHELAIVTAPPTCSSLVS